MEAPGLFIGQLAGCSKRLFNFRYNLLITQKMESWFYLSKTYLIRNGRKFNLIQKVN
jgi:hypothetical protein